MIHFDLSFSYQNGSSFKMMGHVQPKELIGLSGPSGAGKSTLLRLLAGLEKPSSGQLIVGDNIWFDSKKAIWLPVQMRPMGFVFQDGALFPHMTVKEQIIYAANQQNRGWMDQLIRETGLLKLINRYPRELSGGQKQRVALARALAKKPQLLLLDEPLSAIDHDAKEQLQNLLQLIHNKHLIYTILVSHDIRELLSLSHRVFRCENGCITKTGNPHKMLLPKTKDYLSARILFKRYIRHQWTLTLLVDQTTFKVAVTDQEAQNFQEQQMIEFCPSLSHIASKKSFIH